jgi:CheY-specific phosphatase CheX
VAKPNEAIIPLSLSQSLKDTFQIQLSLPIKVTAEATNAAEALKATAALDVVSMMGLKCTVFTGSLALGFPKNTFLKIVETMLGEVYTEVSAQNADACSELLNMIYAGARVKINEAGFDFQPAIPTTVSGKEISLPMGQHTTFLRFLCETERGSFLLALSLKRS